MKRRLTGASAAGDAVSVQDRAEARGVHVGGEEEGETLRGAPQRDADL